MNNPVKVAICIPTHRTWYALFGVCLTKLIKHTECNQWNGRSVNADVFLRTHSVLPKARTDLVDDALNWGADWILFIDDDMTFPPYLLYRMLDHRKNVLGINGMKKEFECKPTAAIEVDGKPGPVLNSALLAGVAPVDYLATGVLLLNTHVFRTLEKPWFAYLDRDRPGDFGISEDYFLCRKLREAGHKLYVDHDLSKDVGHIGPIIFTPTCITTSQAWGSHGIAVSGM